MMDQRFLTKLKEFGLNSYEAKIWSALLSRGISSAGELSDISNVPRSRAYDVLESLEKKGFVVMKLGKPIKYLAVPPVEVVERVKKSMKEEADDKLGRLEELKKTDVLGELNTLHTQGIDLVDPTDISGSIRGRNNLYSHLDLTIRNAEKTVTMMTTSQGLLRKIEALKPTFEKLKKRGVSIRIAAPITKETKPLVDEISKFAEVRHTDAKGRFCVVDGKEVTFMVLDDKDVHASYDVGIWANSPFFAGALESMFDASWKSMKAAK